jgi:predicted nuclease of predicted toxin-antitoxin system
MLKCLSDENFNGDLIRALAMRSPEIDIVRVQDVGLAGTEDSDVLKWAAENGRIVLTHDRATFPYQAYLRVISGETMPGAIIVGQNLLPRQVIEDLALIATCSSAEEWSGRVLYLPL